MIASYGPDLSHQAEHWDYFFYDSHNRIIRDSLLWSPLIVDGKPTYVDGTRTGEVIYGYDQKNRITSAITLLSGDTVFVDSYSYDGAGNRVGPTYDNKINFRQTNPIWQFLGRDYSVNNPLNATYTYNPAGLPVFISGAKDRSIFIDAISGSIYYSSATIHYYSY